MSEALSILNVLWKIVFIVFFFGFCVFIHEFGHLLAALWQKLHVERFSVGFGRKIWGFTYKGVEYTIGWLPFGGFVSLPQLDPTDKPETSDNRPLEPAKPWPRAITAFAGPFFNLIFGFVLATVMWGVGVYEAPPATSILVTSVPKTLPEYKNGLGVTDAIVAFNGKPTDKYFEELCLEWEPSMGDMTLTVQRGEERKDIVISPEPNPEWASGLRPGDRIVALNGKPFTKGTTEFLNEYILIDTPDVTLDVVRDGERRQFAYKPKPNALMENLNAPFFGTRNPIAIEHVIAGSPADKAGIRPGDQILQFNKANVLNAADLTARISELKEGTFTLLLSRAGKEVTAELPATAGTPLLASLGLRFAVTISSVLPDSPAKKAGLKPHDKILSIDGQEFTDAAALTSYIKSTEGRPMEILLARDGKTISLTDVRTKKMDLNGTPAWIIGITLENASPKVIGHPNPWRQFTNIFNQTRRTLGLLFAPVTSAVTRKPKAQGTVGLQHMSGPLGIMMMLWYSLKAEGLRGGLSLIILISFSLAFMNLLPIPVLDGGHILFAFIEIIIRRRLPVKLLVIIQNVFAVLIIALFLYISFFDGKRLVRLFKTGSIKAAPPAKVETKP